MNKDELKTKIIGIIKENSMGSFASVKDGKPWVRYVMVHIEDDMNLYFTTSNSSRKIAQILSNPNCHITLAGNPKDFSTPYIQVAGKAEILKDMKTKKKFWNDYLGKMFIGVEDPDYVVVKVKPEFFEIWGMGGMSPKPEIYNME